MPPPNSETGPDGASEPAPNTLAVGALGVEPILKQPSDIVFDAAHAVYFLDAVFNEVNSGRLGLSVMKSDGQWGHSRHFQWLRFAAAWADQQDQSRPAAIYFRATVLPPEGIKSGRGGGADSHALRSCGAMSITSR
jgi:hypothetical protein